MTIKYAPSWKRLVSYLIDFIVTYIVVLIAAVQLALSQAALDWLFYTLFFSYGTFMEYKYQATLGKMLLRMKVIKTNGQQPDLMTSFYRNFGKIVSALPLAWGFIRLLTPAFKQGIHDEIARCYVVDR